MVSERKKLLALLDRRQQLEDTYNATPSPTTKADIDSFNPALLRYFHCSNLQALQQLYPTTADMKAAAEKQRYFAPRKTPLQRTGEIYEDLRRAGTDVDYLEFVRVSKSVFLSIVSSVLSQHQVFKNHSNNGQETIEKQLAITLWRLGHYGGNSVGIGEASKIFGLSEGTIMKCTQRCMEAMRDVSLDVISWPSQGEKRTIKSRIKDMAALSVHSAGVSSSSMSGLSAQGSSRSGSGSSSDISRSKRQTSRGAITDAVGIMTSMHVRLLSRPQIKNTGEYLVPLHPTALASAAALSAYNSGSKHTKSRSQKTLSMPEFTNSTADTVASAGNAKVKRSRHGKKTDQEKNASDREDGPKQTKRRGRPRKSESASEEQLLTSKSTLSSKQPHQKSATSELSSTSTLGADQAPGSELEPDPSDSSVSAPKPKKTRTRPPTFVKSAYLKRDYGYNIMIVCDSTTRIRYSEVSRPAAWTDQQVLASSQLYLDRATLFEEGEYVIAGSGVSPSANVLPMFSETELFQCQQSQHPLSPEFITTKAIHPPGPSGVAATAYETDWEAKRIFNETLATVQKRGMDCQRTLKARFPSLLGMRVQIKDDGASQDNAQSWILACMTVHNLVLGDDSSYDKHWEVQLEEMENRVLQQQEQQARLIWRMENRVSTKRAVKSNAEGRGEALMTKSSSGNAENQLRDDCMGEGSGGGGSKARPSALDQLVIAANQAEQEQEQEPLIQKDAGGEDDEDGDEEDVDELEDSDADMSGDVQQPGTSTLVRATSSSSQPRPEEVLEYEEGVKRREELCAGMRETQLLMGAHSLGRLLN